MKRVYLLLNLCFLAGTLFAQVSTTQLSGLIRSQLKQGYTSADINGYMVTSQYTDKGTGVTHTYVRQTVNGIPVYNKSSDLHTDRNGNLIVMHNQFVADAISRINAATASLTPSDAVMAFARTIGRQVNLPMSKNQQVNGQSVYTFHDGAVSDQDIEVRAFYQLIGEQLQLVWNVEFYDNETGDWWNGRVDALTGALVDKDNMTVSCNASGVGHTESDETETHMLDASTEEPKTVMGKANGNGMYKIIPMPFESFGFSPRILTEGTPTSNGSPYGWHDTDGVAGADWTITRGNNVYASDDTANKNRPGFSPDGDTLLMFDHPYDPRNPSSDNLPAVITNLFYWNNLVHDVFYNYGFDEVSGNFQANNYGKGGEEHDCVMADAQDGSGTNNANFATPIDGKQGRMQMYLWTRQNAGKNGMKVDTPNAFAGNYDAIPAVFGPRIMTDIRAQLVLVQDGSTDYTGCGTITNDLTGKIALVYRKTQLCSNAAKVLNAQNSGAIAVIVVNNNTFPPSAMSGSSAGLTIPAVMISKTTGDNLKNRLLANDSIMVTLLGDSNANVLFDSDMDNGVITHEFGHGISTRLTGGPSNSSCLNNGEQAGEGWSDFFALALTARASDSLLDGRSMGTWVYDQPADGLGIRTYKYSKNKVVNPMTYNSIKSYPEVHYVGSVWCTVLYDFYLDMISKYGFNPDFYNPSQGGNNMALQLVIDGLKYQPCSPGFVDSRNAILMADSIRNGGANKKLIWTAFARRGLGWSAKQGTSTSVTDNFEAFDLPPFLGVRSNEKAWEQIRVYPNPASDFVQIALPELNTIMDFTLTDITGKIVDQQRVDPTAGNMQIQTSAFAKGVYLVNLSDGTHSFTSKLIIR